MKALAGGGGYYDAHPMADAFTGRQRGYIGFPERGHDGYVEDALKVGLFRRVPVAQYSACTVQRLLQQATLNGTRFFGMMAAGGFGKPVDGR